MTDTTDLDALLAGDIRDAASRLVLADALEECGRDAESALVRGPEPITVHEGRVYRVRMVNETPILRVWADDNPAGHRVYLSITGETGRTISVSDALPYGGPYFPHQREYELITDAVECAMANGAELNW